MCSSSQSTAGQDEPYDLGTGYNHMALTVDDIDAALADAGGDRRPAREAARTTRATASELPLIAFVADPDGYRIELIDGGALRDAAGLAARRSTFEPGTMSSRPSGQRTQALWPPS